MTKTVMIIDDSVSLRRVVNITLSGAGYNTIEACDGEDALNKLDGKKVHLPLHAILNGEKIGSPNAGFDMTFDFTELLEHCAKSRSLVAGTVIGSGTVSNKGSLDGSCCLAEVRCLETIANGKPSTPFMSFGDRVEIDMFDKDGNTIFGRIDQKVVKFK